VDALAGGMPDTIRLDGDAVELVDQRRLPDEVVVLRLTDYREVADAIRDMAIRGAPAIGLAGAFGVVLAAAGAAGLPRAQLDERISRAASELKATRPTAVNLAWAIDRMMGVAASDPETPPDRLVEALRREAQAMREEDVDANRAIGANGNALVPAGATILTHCNAGALATGGYGTALGVVRAAHESGKGVRVFACETRPRLQGARLTTWELMRDGIDVTLITDGMAGSFLRAGEINLVVVGADRIARNGDVANKIGTYALAVLAQENGVPFYVAAPTSTVDLSLSTGEEIVIEERSEDEVTCVAGVRVAPGGVKVRNPAFDVTPNRYVTAIVTEAGVTYPPYPMTLERAAARDAREAKKG